jgi:hypothetical protein
MNYSSHDNNLISASVNCDDILLKTELDELADIYFAICLSYMSHVTTLNLNGLKALNPCLYNTTHRSTPTSKCLAPLK